jgi:hypothetical protein
MAKKFVLAAAFLLIILFCYAGLAKGRDIPTFRAQMMQSPLIPRGLIPLLAVAVPVTEFIAACLLAIEKTRLIGFYLSYVILFSFSVYLVLLVSLYSGNIPCACGGILGKLGYPSHIIFNLVFSMLALLSIIILSKKK